MCIGCRERSTVSELVRLVVVNGAVVPDPHRRLPGRGAAVHLDPVCVDLAVRRKAFRRAFRLAVMPDIGALQRYVAERRRE